MQRARPTASGKAHLERGDYARAEACFREALVARPDDPVALVGLAKVFVGTKRKDEAVETCERAARLYLEHGRTQKAVEIGRRIVKIAPERPDGHDVLAEALRASGENAGAVNALRTAARLYREARKPEKAARVLRRLAELLPEGERSRARVEMAAALSEAGRTAEALEEYREELRVLDAVMVLEVIGNRASMDSGPAHDLLITCLQRVVELDPTDEDARRRLARGGRREEEE